MTLYLKYRPQTLDELDLESVRDNLKRIIASGNIPHSFLFSGPKGTGKTSAARILAKIINCDSLKDGEPCNNCSSCLSITNGSNIDVIELDAASNRGIDDVRNLKSSINLMPASAKKKVYIIDEAHMLTLEAANAFLKTLEEPPDHVIFILATTNPEKLPATVISRLTRVDFTKATDEEISRQLLRVAKGEKIKIEEKAALKISKLADGSFRDAVKILESIMLSTKDIKDSDIKDSNDNITKFFEILGKSDTKKILEFIEGLNKNGISINNFSEKILENIHKNLLAKNGLGEDNLRDFNISDLINLHKLIALARKQTSPVSQLPFEIAIVKFCNTKKKESQPVILSEGKSDLPKSKNPLKSESKTKILNEATWQKLLAEVRQKNVSIEALLRATKPLSFDGKILAIGVYYKFHKEHLEDGKSVKILEDICKNTLQIDSVKIEYELIDKPKKETIVDKVKDTLSAAADKDIIEAAKEIFG